MLQFTRSVSTLCSRTSYVSSLVECVDPVVLVFFPSFLSYSKTAPDPFPFIMLWANFCISESARTVTPWLWKHLAYFIFICYALHLLEKLKHWISHFVHGCQYIKLLCVLRERGGGAGKFVQIRKKCRVIFNGIWFSPDYKVECYWCHETDSLPIL